MKIRWKCFFVGKKRTIPPAFSSPIHISMEFSELEGFFKGLYICNIQQNVVKKTLRNI
jgi:hypothetical protein